MDGTYIGAEVLKGVTLDGVDAQLGVGLDDGEATGDCGCKAVRISYLTQVTDCPSRNGSGARIERTEEVLGSATLLNNLNKTGLELLNGGDVVGKDTHLAGGGGDVDLGPVVAKVRQYSGIVEEACEKRLTNTPVER